ncbi:MAG: hypothetical protein HUU20_00340 [Pirellulales bacterium]|nr:hypothetical protein [Pirellulales bacterium]
MSLTSDLKSVTKSVTKNWTAQRKREERDSRARYSRAQYMQSDRVYQKDVAWSVIPKAYAKASSNGKYPAHARQIFYAARPEIQKRTGRPLQSVYFTQHLLPMYINEHPEAAAWWIVYDARGRLIEPHTDEQIPLGTLEVNNYLLSIGKHEVVGFDFHEAFDTDYPTKGPANRMSAVLFIEKEGFNELFKAVKLAERYDLSIMSSKGQSVVAARRLVDWLCDVGGGVPLLVLHDFDKAGLEIAQNLTTVSEAARESDRVRYEFRNEINVIDLGIRLTDVEQWHLEAESVRFKGDFGPDSIVTSDEQAFLRSNRRVELNAFASEDFIKWIEAKLKEHGIKKVIPDADTLADAYRRAYLIASINRHVDDFLDEARDEADEVQIPKRLAARIKKALREDPARPWDAVLADIAKEDLDEKAC